MRHWIVCIAALTVPACSTPGEPRLGPDDVTVELDAFSGLPNPRWALTTEESGELAARLSALPSSTAATLPDPVLGYRGFRIENPGGEGGIPEVVYVSRGGLLQIMSTSGAGQLLEDHRGAESFLVEASRRRGYADVFRE